VPHRQRIGPARPRAVAAYGLPCEGVGVGGGGVGPPDGGGQNSPNGLSHGGGGGGAGASGHSWVGAKMPPQVRPNGKKP